MNVVVCWLSPVKANVWHLRRRRLQQLPSPWSDRYTREGVFHFAVLAPCLRRPLFTKIVSELLPLQQVLGPGLLQLQGMGRSCTKWRRGLRQHFMLLF